MKIAKLNGIAGNHHVALERKKNTMKHMNTRLGNTQTKNTMMNMNTRLGKACRGQTYLNIALVLQEV